MKIVLSRSVIALICMGALMNTVQTWAHEDEDKVLTRIVDEQPIDKNKRNVKEIVKQTMILKLKQITQRNISMETFQKSLKWIIQIWRCQTKQISNSLRKMMSILDS